MAHYHEQILEEQNSRDKKMTAKSYHSGNSEADNSQTPWWIVRQIQAVANVSIVHDVCAKENSSKAFGSYWSAEDDALSLDWCEKKVSITGSRSVFWMNPPFSLAKEFTTKAADEAQKGVTTIGCVKHAPDADWFQEMEKRATVIYVPDGRIQFLKADGSEFTRTDKKGKTVKSGANFPLCFPLWTPYNHGFEAKYVRFSRNKKIFSDT